MKHLSKTLTAWLPLAALTLASCDMMTDDRSDCPTGLYLSFKYDYNLERADMFGDHVGAVDVYVFDEAGRYVKTLSDANAGDYRPLAAPGYAMRADLLPGKYQFVVLAGQVDYATQLASSRAKFRRAELATGDDRQQLDIRLDATPEGSDAVVVDNHGLPLDTLWHGMETTPVEVFADKPTYHTISLIRDTKKINVTLRDIDHPETVDVDDYAMTITDHNERLLWDNSVDESSRVTYTPHATWNTDDRTPAYDAQGNPVGGVGRIAHADFMTSRILYHDDPADDGVLSIVSKQTGVEVVRVDLPDLLSRLRNSEEIYRYTPQEFLDRGYDFQLDFYLKGGYLNYVTISISVLGWTKRVQVEDL